MPAHLQTFNSLRWCSLDADQHAKTCRYWYVVTAGGMSHTAFRTRELFLSWAERLGLDVEAEAVPQVGVWATGKIGGTYRRALHRGKSAENSWEYVGGYDEFFALKGLRIRVMDNSDVTVGIITSDADDFRTVHVLNPNMRDRPILARDLSTIEGY